MAYLAPDPAVDEALTRAAHRDPRRTKAATTVGYGPRFLHSTGQLHKGGAPTGVFVQLVDGGGARVEIPGEPYDFAALVRAQAIGDGQALRARGLPFLRIELGEDAAAGDRGARRGARVSTAQAPVAAPANPFARTSTSACRRPRRSSCSARPATSPRASCCRPSTTCSPTAACPSASACSRSCAKGRTRRRSAPARARRSTRTHGARSTSACGTRSRRASASSPATTARRRCSRRSRERLDEGDREDGEPSQRLFYLAISPAFFADDGARAVRGRASAAAPTRRRGC